VSTVSNIRNVAGQQATMGVPNGFTAISGRRLSSLRADARSSSLLRKDSDDYVPKSGVLLERPPDETPRQRGVTCLVLRDTHERAPHERVNRVRELGLRDECGVSFAHAALANCRNRRCVQVVVGYDAIDAKRARPYASGRVLAGQRKAQAGMCDLLERRLVRAGNELGWGS
jgi:hypothetical protein